MQSLSEKNAYFGTLPERLGIGLQNRGRRFESARYLKERAAQESGSFCLTYHIHPSLKGWGRWFVVLDIGRPLGYWILGIGYSNERDRRNNQSGV